jgi:heat shock protein HtpX
VTLQQQIRANRFRTALVLVAFALLIASIAGAVYTLYDIGVGALVLGIGAAYGIYAYVSSGRLVAKLTGAHPVTREEWPEVYHLIDTVSIAAGMEAAPPLYMVDDPAPNAFAAGRTPATSYVVVTKGLLDAMSKRELEGVLAHEVSHIRNRDVRLMTLAAVLVGVVALISDLLARMLYFGGGRRKGGGNSGWIFLVLAIVTIILAPLAAVMIQMSLSRRREYLADASAAEITNDPEGLALALRRLELDQREIQHVNQATAHLYIETPLRNTAGPAKFMAGLFNTHPPLAARIGVLEEAGGFRLPDALPQKSDLETAGA